MKSLDFLSSLPSLYLLKESRGKNKTGGFFSLLLIISMVATSIYYFYIYFSGKNYDLKFFKDNWTTSFTNEEIKSLNQQKEWYLNISENINNAIIVPYLIDEESNYTIMKKCKEIYDDDSFEELYCFNLSFYHLQNKGFQAFYLRCEDNCNDLYGNPSYIEITLFTSNLKIDHNKKNPLIFTEVYGDKMTLMLSNITYSHYLIEFTPIIYKTTEILKPKEKVYINSYLNNFKEQSYDIKDNYFFAGFNTVLSTNSDIYERRYITLLETLSQIGGLFTTFKMFFTLFIIFYSELDNNYEITKKVILKKNFYKNNNINKIKLRREVNIDDNKYLELINDKKQIDKNLKINSCKHFFLSFTNFLKCTQKRKTMKILNVCDNFVKEYLSAENIIFNMVLFEQFYEDNPINVRDIHYLKEIEKEIKDDNENNILLNPLNDT